MNKKISAAIERKLRPIYVYNLTNALTINRRSTISSVCRNLLKYLHATFSKLFFLATYSLVFSSTSVQAEEAKFFLQAASSPNFVGTNLAYSNGYIYFTDLDADDEEEFIGIEKTAPKSLKRYATISRWTDKGRTIEWRSDRLSTIRSFLVGNLDGDSLNEVVLFGQKSENSQDDTLQILDWDGSAYKTILSTNNFSGQLGALLDIDNDGVDEIALTTLDSPIPFADSDGRVPATLNILRFSDGKLSKVHSLPLPTGIRALATSDLNNDGLIEVLTFESEVAFDGLARRKPHRENGCILIYSIDPESGIQQYRHIKSIVRSNRQSEMPYLSQFRTFSCADRNYLFVETVQQRWKSIMVASKDEYDRLDLTLPNWDNIELFEYAWRSAMAYSRENRAYAQFIDSQSFQFIPEEHIHTKFATNKCEISP